MGTQPHEQDGSDRYHDGDDDRFLSSRARHGGKSDGPGPTREPAPSLDSGGPQRDGAAQANELNGTDSARTNASPQSAELNGEAGPSGGDGGQEAEIAPDDLTFLVEKFRRHYRARQTEYQNRLGQELNNAKSRLSQRLEQATLGVRMAKESAFAQEMVARGEEKKREFDAKAEELRFEMRKLDAQYLETILAEKEAQEAALAKAPAAGTAETSGSKDNPARGGDGEQPEPARSSASGGSEELFSESPVEAIAAVHLREFRRLLAFGDRLDDVYAQWEDVEVDTDAVTEARMTLNGLPIPRDGVHEVPFYGDNQKWTFSFQQRVGGKWEPVMASPDKEGRVVATVFAVPDRVRGPGRMQLFTTESTGALTLHFDRMMEKAPPDLLEKTGVAFEVHLSGYPSFTLSDNDGDYGTVLLQKRDEYDRRDAVDKMEAKYDGRTAYANYTTERQAAEEEGREAPVDPNMVLQERHPERKLASVKVVWVPKVGEPIPLQVLVSYEERDGDVQVYVHDTSSVVSGGKFLSYQFMAQPTPVESVSLWQQEAAKVYPNGVLMTESDTAGLAEPVQKALRPIPELQCMGEALDAKRDADEAFGNWVRDSADMVLGSLPLFIGDLWDLANVVVGEITDKTILGAHYDPNTKYFLAATLLPFVSVGMTKWARKLTTPTALLKEYDRLAMAGVKLTRREFETSQKMFQRLDGHKVEGLAHEMDAAIKSGDKALMTKVARQVVAEHRTALKVAAGKHDELATAVRSWLPSDLHHVKIDVNPALGKNEVNVGFMVDADGVVEKTSMRLSVGVAPDPAFVEVHGPVLKSLQKYTGFRGKLRKFFEDWKLVNAGPNWSKRSTELQAELQKLTSLESKLGARQAKLETIIAQGEGTSAHLRALERAASDRHLIQKELDEARGLLAKVDPKAAATGNVAAKADGTLKRQADEILDDGDEVLAHGDEVGSGARAGRETPGQDFEPSKMRDGDGAAKADGVGAKQADELGEDLVKRPDAPAFKDDVGGAKWSEAENFDDVSPHIGKDVPPIPDGLAGEYAYIPGNPPQIRRLSPSKSGRAEYAVEEKVKLAVVDGKLAYSMKTRATFEEVIGRAAKDFPSSARLDPIFDAHDVPDELRGMLRRWDGPLDVFEANGVDVETMVSSSLRDFDGVVGENSFRKLERSFRAQQVEAIVSVQQGTKQKKLLDDVIAAQYENGNRGALLGAYREAKLKAGDSGPFSVPDAPVNSALEGTVKEVRPRMVDGTAVLDDDIPGLPAGRYAWEDKAGTSWNSKQAKAYIKHINEHGKLKLKGGEMDGLIYFAQSETHADVLAAKLADLQAPDSIKVAFLSEDGLMELL